MEAALAFILTMFPEALQPTSITPATTRAIAVALASSVSILVCRLCWPVQAGRDLRLKLAAILERSNGLLREILRPLLEPEKSSAEPVSDLPGERAVRLSRRARQTLHEVEALTPLVGEATLEARDQGFRRHQGVAVLGALEEVLRHLEALSHDFATPPREDAAGLLRTEVRELARSVGALLDSLTADLRSASQTSPNTGIRAAMERIEARALELRQERRWIALPLDERRALFAILGRLAELARGAEDLANAIAHPAAL